MKQEHTSNDHQKAQKVLDGLGNRSVVLDGNGYAWQQGGLCFTGYWYRAYGDERAFSSYELAFEYPITVLYDSNSQ